MRALGAFLISDLAAMPAPELLDPKNDLVFKLLFAHRLDLLADLINAVRSDQPPVDVVEVLNPRIEPEELTGKLIVLDVLARDAAGSLYGVEMQVRHQPGWAWARRRCVRGWRTSNTGRRTQS
ncbi:MAG: PD-(D/E)XK nuclease family transposase [Burkholderiales bacterium]|nr:PD-(D/E)XK nuclease family transposase [Burkholderiales bacterium]